MLVAGLDGWMAGVTSIIIILTNGGLAGGIRLILTNYHSFLSFNSRYFSTSRIVNKIGRKTGKLVVFPHWSDPFHQFYIPA